MTYLVQSPKEELEFAVQQRSLDPIHHSPRNRPEAGIARDGIVAECDGNIVEIRRIRRPKLRRRVVEREVLVGVDLVLELVAAGVAGSDGDLSGSAEILGRGDCAEDFQELAVVQREGRQSGSHRFHAYPRSSLSP